MINNRLLLQSLTLLLPVFAGLAILFADEKPVASVQKNKPVYSKLHPLEFHTPWHELYSWKAEEYFDDPKMIAFCHAIERNDLKTIRGLIKSGIDVNKTGKGSATLLLWAFSTNDTTAFQLLLEHKADPNVVLTEDFDRGIGIGFPLVAGDCVTLMSARARFPRRLDLVMKHGADINIVHRQFMSTPLHEAINVATFPDERRERVAKIIAAGADVDFRTSNGSTPAMWACISQRYDLVVLLLDGGADPNAYSRKNLQLIHVAAIRKRLRNEENKQRREANIPEIPFSREKVWNEMMARLTKAGFSLKQAEKDLATNAEWRRQGKGNYMKILRQKREKEQRDKDPS